MEQLNTFLSTTGGKVVSIAALAIGAHLLVLLIRTIDRIILKRLTKKRAKWSSIQSLGFSILIFTVYFVAIGKVLMELGVSLTAYIASASVIGLAVGFGTQGLIQDVITGVTIVFSNLMNVGELVEVNGVTGVVRSINMRFIEIEDHLGTLAYIPNRTITKVVRYPKGYLSCSIDFVNTPKLLETPSTINEIDAFLKSVKDQFQGIFRGSISMYNDKTTSTGKKYSRIKLRIWPGRTQIIDSTLKQELLDILKKTEPDYKDWMLSINYEIENGKNKKHKNGNKSQVSEPS
ncbi:MAG: mechanosensitive ion channel family protein [Salinivirgaceae bacterium]